jgi:hypothetical protein
MATPYLFVDNRQGITTGQQLVYTQGMETVAVGRKIHVTLVYTDAPGTASAQKALVNDLDLSVMDPMGKIYYPNHLSEADHVNNVETIEFDAPVAGAYKVIVKGTNVPVNFPSGNGQPYAVLFNYR